MTMPPATIGPYRIDRELGRGGMGVVYLGHDTRLDRRVAVKALPEHLAQDPERLARFEREAKTLAALNHPNVAGIHGVEEHAGHRYLVLEYVEGETLAERLDRGPLPIDEALEIAVQIASGVEAAHEAGVIHRDLKPGNVIVTPDGKAKVLDFGLARMAESASASGSSMSPTLTSPVGSPTMPGVILGTAAYMSPEQARGRRVDKRSDIWSFGVILYEMLTGASPFIGETITDSLGAILHKDVDLDRLPAQTPALVRHVLARCLARDKARRYRDIGDVRVELESDDATDGSRSAGAHRPGDRALLAVVAVVALASLIGLGVALLRPPRATPTRAPVRLSIPLPVGMEVEGSIAISRDGSTLAFSATDSTGESNLYLRRLDEFEMRRVPRSRDAHSPFFSPDGVFVGFHARDRLQIARVDGGNPTPVASPPSFTGASWGEDGTIVYSASVGSPLRRIRPDGSGLETLVELADDAPSYAHVWPQHIPGTSKLLFTAWGGENIGGARIMDLDTRKIQPLNSAGSTARRFMPPARWVASGHVILENFGDLLVAPFDPQEGVLPPEPPSQLLASVFHLGNTTRSVFAVSDNGTMAYVPGNPRTRRLVWVDRDGEVEPILAQGDIESGFLGGELQLSPDSRRAVFGGGGDIGEVDLDRRIARRLTFDEANDTGPVWSADGDRVYFASNRDQRWSIWSVPSSGGREELVLQTENNTYPASIASDGRLLYTERFETQGVNIKVMTPDGETTSLVETAFDEKSPRFSPDGSWVAYDSDAAGRREVFVVPSDGGAGPVQVSFGGGSEPKWASDGASIYFRRGRAIMQIDLDAGRPVSEAARVFDAPNLLTGGSYDITADGLRLLAVQLDDEAIPDEIRIVTNFFDEIRRVVGGETP